MRGLVHSTSCTEAEESTAYWENKLLQPAAQDSLVLEQNLHATLQKKKKKDIFQAIYGNKKYDSSRYGKYAYSLTTVSFIMQKHHI